MTHEGFNDVLEEGAEIFWKDAEIKLLKDKVKRLKECLSKRDSLLRSLCPALVGVESEEWKRRIRRTLEEKPE